MRLTCPACLGLGLLALACFEDPIANDTSSGDDEVDGTTTDTGETTDSADTTTSTDESTEESSTDTGMDTTGESTESGTDTMVDTGVTDDPLPECGNGVVEGDELCDDGPEPELAPGACRPDCAGTIETRTVVRSATVESGNFGNNPVAFADSKCEPGYEAMFAYATNRVATTTAWQSEGAVDWPVQPWTAYETMEGELVWVTDEVAQIGVRDGAHVDVLANMGGGGCFGNPPICFFYSMVTGMNADGTTLISNTCNGWTSGSDTQQASYGSFVTGEYATDTTGCTFSELFVTSYAFLCVEL
jgi:hypothetical protein